MSDRLRQSLMSSRSEIEAGLAEAGAELARVRQRAAELEELIALGTATLLAAEMISGGAKPTGPEPAAAEAAAVENPPAAEPAMAPPPGSEPQTAPAVETEAAMAATDAEVPTPTPSAEPEPAQSVTYEDDLRALLERAQS